MKHYFIMTVLVNNRREDAILLQETLTKSGCIIKTRLGLHQAGDTCSDEGLIILELTGNESLIMNLEKELNAIQGIKAQLSMLSNDWK
jgi:hypothetical protein